MRMAWEVIRCFISGPLLDLWFYPICIVLVLYTYRRKNKITGMRQILDISKGIYPEGISPTLDGSEIGARIRMSDGTLREFKDPRSMGNTGLRARK